MKVNYISNDGFKYLSPKDRDTLKKHYKNYVYRNHSFYYYVQDKDEVLLRNHIVEIVASHCNNKDDIINIFISEKLGLALGYLKEEQQEELF